MYNLRKRARVEKDEEALKGPQGKKVRHDTARPKVVVQKPSKSRPKAKMDPPKAKLDHPKAKGFSSLPCHLQELVLLKTSTQTRMKLFQVNGQLREWVCEEGLIPRDVERIETTYRDPRPREKIASNDSLRIFKILPRSGFADIVEIDEAKAKKSMVFRNIRSCRNLAVTRGEEDDFRIAEFFPNLRSLGTFDIDEFDEALLEGTSFQVTLALNFPNYFYGQGEYDEEKLFEWMDMYASRCPSINFSDVPFERTVEFLKTRKLRFIEYSFDSVRDDRGIVEMILKNGIPGEHPDPCVKIGVGPGLMIHVISSISRNGTLVVGDLQRILKKFKDHSAEVGWSFDDSVLGSNAVGFTSRFDENKNMIFLLFENDDDVAELLIKYETIEK